MPLIKGKSPASFSKNVETEMHEGKPLKQSLAIAYAMKKKAKHHMAHGGMMHGKEAGRCAAHGMDACHMCHGGKMMAKGGFVHEEEAHGYLPEPKEHEKHNAHAMKEDHRMLNQHGEHEEGAEGMHEDNEPQHERMVHHAEENQGFPHEEEDMVGRIMKQREHHYSHGGRVANDTPITADFEKNQFDDLVKDDDLEEHETGANSGDELGDEAEDHDRHDVVSRIMKSRRKKDRLPHPM